MHNTGIMFAQVAAEAEIAPNKAKVAIYLKQLAEQGKSLSYASSALRRDKATIKKYAREFLIDFPDYRPFERMERAGKERPKPKYELRPAA